MYIVAKEQYLTTLLNEGTISQDEFDKMDRFLYERFHIKGTNGNILSATRTAIAPTAPTLLPSKPKAEKNTPQETSAKEEISEPTMPQSIAFVSLTEATRSCTEDSPAHVIQSWMRNRNTLEFLGLWESAHNPDFNHEGYVYLMEKQKVGSFAVTPKQWIDQTNAVGMTSKQGKNGGTYAQPLIACEFMMWLSPTYKLALLEMHS
jgi:KilA-N domain.